MTERVRGCRAAAAFVGNSPPADVSNLSPTAVSGRPAPLGVASVGLGSWESSAGLVEYGWLRRVCLNVLRTP